MLSNSILYYAPFVTKWVFNSHIRKKKNILEYSDTIFSILC